jgi:hypothetical protein
MVEVRPEVRFIKPVTPALATPPMLYTNNKHAVNRQCTDNTHTINILLRANRL